MEYSRTLILNSLTLLFILTVVPLTDAQSSFQSLGSFQISSPAGNFPVEFFSIPSLQNLVSEFLPSALSQTIEKDSKAEIVKIDSECLLGELYPNLSMKGFHVVVIVGHSNRLLEISRCGNFEFDVYTISTANRQITEALSQALRLIKDRKINVGKASIFISSDTSRSLSTTPVLCTGSTFYNISSSACANCPSNCLKCSTSSSCTVCNTGSFNQTSKVLTNAYYRNSTGQCIPCTIIGCSICINNTYCQLCDSSYSLTSNNQCKVDTNNCLQYSASSVCQACPLGTNLYSGVCVNCSVPTCNCNSTGSCVSCTERFYMENSTGMCKNCLSYCQNCSSPTTCLSCDPGFWISNGLCQQCSEGCGMCTSLSVCSYCKPGYVLASGVCSVCPSSCYKCVDGVCLNCSSGYYADPVSGGCLPCQDSCLDCVNASYCYRCKVGVSVGGVCNGCGDNCLSCSLLGCTLCVNGYYYDRSSNSCLECQDGCLSCSGTFCFESIIGFYLANNQTTLNKATIEMPYPAPCPSQCDVCNLTGSCLYCSNGAYLLANGTCYPCSTNCKTCTTTSICTQCNNGYYLNTEGFCTLCSAGCSSCQQGVCQSCTQGFYYNSNTTDACFQCMANCNVCLDARSCRVCAQGFYFNGSSCQSCIAGCSNCTNATSCDSCSLTFYKNSSGGCSQCGSSCNYCTSNVSCVKCADGYFADSSGTCFACSSNCTHCISNTQCIECLAGYVLSANYTCQSVTPYCLNVKSVITPYTCASCLTGYYLSSTSCVACPTNCSSCVNYNGKALCTQCIDGFSPSITDLSTCIACGTNCVKCVNSTYCLNCKPNYAKSRNATGTVSVSCQPIPTNCALYKTNGTNAVNCTACLSGYYLSNNSCLACSPNCNVCTSKGCSQCVNSYYLNSTGNCTRCSSACLTCSDGSTCSSCLVGYVFNSTTQTCNKCGDKCIACNTTGACSQCRDFYFLNGSGVCLPSNCTSYNSTICLACQPQYILNALGVCIPNFKCPEACSACPSPNYCTACQSNYYLGTTGKCVPCPQYCTNGCQNATNCNGCASGYYLQNNTCTPCTKNCQSCISSSSCQQCNSGTFNNGTVCLTCPSGCSSCSDAKSCTSCKTNFNLLNASCLPCSDPNCISCTNTTCLACNKGTYLDTGVCKPCLPNCASCTSNKTCNYCLPSYLLSNVSNQTACNSCGANCLTCSQVNNCTSCVAGAYLDSGICEQCTSNCSVCNATDCLVCSKGFTVSLDGSCQNCGGNCKTCSQDGQCFNCTDGFYLDSSSSCQPCVAGCTSCLDGVNCLACASRFVLQVNNTCGACPSNCSVCDEKGVCSVCVFANKIVNGSCVPCSDTGVVDIKISQDFSTLVIMFSSQITNNNFNCSNVISTNGNLGSNWKCSPNNTNLNVKFGINYAMDDSNLITVSPASLFKNPCSTASYVNLTVNFAKQAPIPKGQIKGMASQSISCSGSSLKYFIDNVSGCPNSLVQAAWNATVVPPNQQVSDYVASCTQTNMSIPTSMFSPNSSSITVTALITNSMKKSSQTSFTTQLLSAVQMAVAIDMGSAVNISCSQELKLTANVIDNCGSVNKTVFTWKITSSSNTSMINTTYNSNHSHQLTIPAYSFTANNYYMVSVFATDGKFNGSSSILISTFSDPLVCLLNVNNGNISPKVNLSLDGGKSYDPDNPQAKLNYIWSCTDPNTNSACIGNDKIALIGNVSAPNFTIPASSLIGGNTMQVLLTVRAKDSRQSSCNATLNLIAGLSTDVQIDFGQSVVLSSNSLVLKGRITSTVKYTLLWIQTMGQSVTLQNATYPSLYLPANSLVAGQVYAFTLMATEVKSNNAALASVQFETAIPPSCSSLLTVSPQTGAALTQTFTLSITACLDNDNTTLPLTYSFAITPQNSQSIYIAKGNSFNSVNFVLFQGSFTAFVRVCDSFGACSFFNLSSPFTVTPFAHRQLQTLDPITLYNSLIQTNPDATVLYGIAVIATFAMTDPQVDSVYNSAVSYMGNETVDADTVDMMMKLILQILISQNSTLSYDRVNAYIQYMLGLVYGSTDQLSSDIVDVATMIHAMISQTGIYDMQYTNVAKLFYDQVSAVYAENMTPGTLIINSTLFGFTFYKYRGISSQYVNMTIELGNGTLVVIESLPFNSSDVIDVSIVIIPDPISYSNIIDITFTDCGTLTNTSLTSITETVVPLTTPTVLFQLPIITNTTGSWGCEYYTGALWEDGGCIFESSTPQTVKMRISHTSMFRLYPSNLIPTSTDDKNYAPVMFSVGLCIVFMIGCCISTYLNQKEMIKVTPMAEYQKVPVQSDADFFRSFTVKDAAHTVDERPRRMYSEVVRGNDSHDIDAEKLREEANFQGYIVKAKSSAKDVVASEPLKKRSMVSSHLFFSMFMKNPDFYRTDRILVVYLIFASQITIQGALIGYNFMDLDELDPFLSKMAFAALSVGFTVPLHIAGGDIRKSIGKCCGFLFVLAVIVLAANIGLTILIALWVTSRHMDWMLIFCWGLLFEIVLESVIMVVKHITRRSYN